MSAIQQPREAATARQKRAASPARAGKTGVASQIDRASTAALKLLHALGLGWVLDAVVTSAAAGIVVGDYGARLARAQATLYADAAAAVLDAERRVTSSMANGELRDILGWLADAIAVRITELNRFLQIPTKNDFGEIADRLKTIDRRVGVLEHAREAKPKSKRVGATKTRRPTVRAKKTTAKPAPASGQSKGARAKRTAAKSETTSTTAAQSAFRADSATARPTIDSSTTMFIGSVPSGDVAQPPLERASSVSSEPDALSAYFAKNPGDPRADGMRGRRRRGADS